MSKPVIVVGAGLSGLTCARTLQAAGVEVSVLERCDAVGGRVRTDVVDGYRLDRGFQILLTGYPELRRHLDLDALELCSFDSGAALWNGRGFETLGDPTRDLGALVPTLLARTATFRDKLAILRLRREVLRGDDYAAFGAEDQSTLAFLQQFGFSASFIDRFFRPFLGGVFLESKLATTSRFFRFVFRMFSSADAAVPALGMAEIPKQLAAGLKEGTLSLSSGVSAVRPDGVRLLDGTDVEAAAVVVATEGPVARQLVPELPEVKSRAVTCFYFRADEPPTSRPILHLNASGKGLVNNLHVVTAVSPKAAPPDEHLVSVSCLGAAEDPEALREGVLAELHRWFGEGARGWSPLRHYVIRHALPAQPVGSLEPPRRPNRSRDGIYICGDHLDQASIDGAMVSGRRAAEAVIADLET